MGLLSSLPNSADSTFLVRGMPITLLHPGQIFYVNNSSVIPDDAIAGSNGNEGSYLQPFASVLYAVSKCKAGRGDIILCQDMRKHYLVRLF